jgi:hypothetical protein
VKAVKRRARPSLTRPLQLLIADVAARLPEFAHVRPEQILVLAGEARRASHATVKPLAFPRSRARISKDGRREKPRVRIGGENILYVITLRPIWFRQSNMEDRVGTLLHELFHLSTHFDGTLHPGRRHAKMGKAFGQRLGPLVRRYLAEAPPRVLAPFSHRGLVRVRMWLEKPPSSFPQGVTSKRLRRVYTEEQLFVGLMRMH